jgi:secreted PhoX family phosphatase
MATIMESGGNMTPPEAMDTSRRRFITAASASTAAALFAPQKLIAGELAPNAQASPASSSMTLNKSDTAVVFIDPQNDVLSEKGIS